MGLKNINDLNYNRFDEESEKNVPIEHYKIHEGKMFNIFGNITLSNDETKIFSCHTDNVEIHFTFFMHCTDDFTLSFYEDSNITNGTITPSINNNRVKNIPSSVTIYEDPTVNNFGTKLFEVSLYGSQAINPSTTRYNEFVLKTNTIYTFVITSGANGTKIFYKFDWYEDEE